EIGLAVAVEVAHDGNVAARAVSQRNALSRSDRLSPERIRARAIDDHIRSVVAVNIRGFGNIAGLPQKLNVHRTASGFEDVPRTLARTENAEVGLAVTVIIARSGNISRNAPSLYCRRAVDVHH